MENPNVSETEFCKAISKLEFLKGMAVDENLICHRSFNMSTNADLEITECIMSRGAILTLLGKLKELEFLDASGYEISGITNEVLEKASHLKVGWDSLYHLGDLWSFISLNLIGLDGGAMAVWFPYDLPINITCFWKKKESDDVIFGLKPEGFVWKSLRALSTSSPSLLGKLASFSSFLLGF
ncbi:hypothetical protein IEQ34_015751 [Dendrobium chrysotoxum]|uniref:Uncharacterized protein n=1 Tax=Dendrobium chrysotoxum TaxID=161865 RepID=A0AAV7GJB3_DENCH|nr:hypothetical protein IEQ34_015751 [Dendrobium chrysotoxum]